MQLLTLIEQSAQNISLFIVTKHLANKQKKLSVSTPIDLALFTAIKSCYII